MKKNISYLGFCGIVIGLVISRFVVDKYGANTRIIIMFVALMISIFSVIGIIYKRKYLGALYMLSIVVPLLIMTIGMYLENVLIGLIGLGSLFILIPIMVKVLPKWKKRQ